MPFSMLFKFQKYILQPSYYFRDKYIWGKYGEYNRESCENTTEEMQMFIVMLNPKRQRNTTVSGSLFTKIVHGWAA